MDKATDSRPVVVEEVDDPMDRIVDEILGETPPPVEADKEDPEESIEEAPEESEEAEPEPEYIELKHNGKPVKLKLDEVIEHAEKGFDYTRKTQELADQRRQVEAYAKHLQQQAQFQQAYQEDSAKITAIDMQLQRFKEVDWSAFTDSDPVEATKAWQRYQLLQNHRAEMASELSQKQANAQREVAQRTESMLREAEQQLQNELGNAWNAETRKALVDHGKHYGFSDEELANVSDPRVVKVLFDALKWNQMQAQKPAVQKKVSEAPKLAKPGAKPAQAESSQKKQLIKMLKSSGNRTTREKAAMALLDDFVR